MGGPSGRPRLPRPPNHNHRWLDGAPIPPAVGDDRRAPAGFLRDQNAEYGAAHNVAAGAGDHPRAIAG